MRCVVLDPQLTWVKVRHYRRLARAQTCSVQMRRRPTRRAPRHRQCVLGTAQKSSALQGFRQQSEGLAPSPVRPLYACL